ncbi:plasmid pRiA4b ORF-3 family protein [Rhodococcus sp. A14]|nr:plasmid pRiA4b ORF-3 family protein [Rhodococcus sp. A14]
MIRPPATTSSMLCTAASPVPCDGAVLALTGLARSTRARARQSQPVTYQVRVDLEDAKPPIWRRLLLSSELMLDELHAVPQQAMGWTDSHLHQFLVGENKMDRFAEQFHMKFMLDDGADGVLENRVRLDELLAKPTDRLFYRSDFGDGWEHTLVVEKALSQIGDDPPALCVGGARACPPEDCGGIWGYLNLLQDPTIAHEAVPDDFDPTYFSVEETNAGLRDLAALPVPNPEGGDRHFQPAATAVGWLPNRVGAPGIRLTAAGFLPPTVGTAAMDELRWREQWIGTCTREDTTAPVFDLRETAAQLRLLRRYRGQLLLTKNGAALRDDPESLRRYLAAPCPHRRGGRQGDTHPTPVPPRRRSRTPHPQQLPGPPPKAHGNRTSRSRTSEGPVRAGCDHSSIVGGARWSVAFGAHQRRDACPAPSGLASSAPPVGAAPMQHTDPCGGYPDTVYADR